jgi:NitT/TauT family transport system permease protein
LNQDKRQTGPAAGREGQVFMSESDVPKPDGFSSGDLVGSLLLLFLLLWGWVVLANNVSQLLFPHPLRVWDKLVVYTLDGQMWRHLRVTLVEILAGFALGGVLGFGCGALLAHSKRARNVLTPYLITTQAVPKFALAPIFILWFGFGIAPKVIITALIAFFPLMENTVVGLQACERDALKLFQSLKSSQWQIFLKLRVPSSLPYVFAGLRVAMVFSIVGAIVAEYVGANVGLGALIIISQGTLDTPLMFAVFVVTTVLGLVLYHLVVLAERLVVGRR